MEDEYGRDGLNGFIDALVNPAEQVEFCTLEHEMPEEEKNRPVCLEIERNTKEEVDM